MKKVIAHLWTLPRWFAAPWFGVCALFGAILSGGITFDAWVGVLVALLVMAGGHSFNSFLDYAWTGLDKGEKENRSAEKDYTSGQNVIENGLVTIKGVFFNAISWYILALLPAFYLFTKHGPGILIVTVLGMLITFWYSWGKFNWTHETSLAVGVGPFACLLGAFSVSSSPDIMRCIIASFPFAITLSYAGLAFDEWPDAEANLKKGVKSIAYYVWKSGFALETYLMGWMIMLYVCQAYLVAIGVYKPMTGISFLALPLVFGILVWLKLDFKKAAMPLIGVFALVPCLIVLGQHIGR